MVAPKRGDQVKTTGEHVRWEGVVHSLRGPRFAVVFFPEQDVHHVCAVADLIVLEPQEA